MLHIPENYKYCGGLQSLRLKTRWLVPSDIRQWARFFHDKESVEFFPDPLGRSAEVRSQEWIEKQLKRYNDRHFGLQALVEKSTGNFIGQCGLLLQEVDGVTEVEVGYHIFSEYRGQGFAPEAAKLFLNYAFGNKLAESVVSIIHRQNLRSQNVAAKNGLRREKESSWRELPIYVYRIGREEFMAR